MKFLALFLSLTFSTMAFSNSTLESLELKPDFKISVNMNISINGCDFWITGWVDVSYDLLHGDFSINSYNLHAEGPCGDYDIIGMIAPPPVNDPNVEVGETTLIKLVTRIVGENLE